MSFNGTYAENGHETDNTDSPDESTPINLVSEERHKYGELREWKRHGRKKKQDIMSKSKKVWLFERGKGGKLAERVIERGG